MEHGDEAARAALVRTIMRRQSGLGLRIAAVFVLILAGLPLLNLFLPDVMSTRVGGFSLTWLFLALLFYPVTWLLSWLFVRGSDRAEDEIVAEMRGRVEALSDRGSRIADLPDDPRSSDSPSAIKKKLFVEDEE